MAEDNQGNNNNGAPRRLHPPTEICSGSLEDDPSKTRNIMVDPNDPRQMKMWSTDQTAKGRPEWLFPYLAGRRDVPQPDLNICYALSAVITDFDERGVTPKHLELVPCQLFEGAPPQQMVARLVHASGANNTAEERQLQRDLEHYFFHKPCPHGILCLVPFKSDMLPLYDSIPHDLKQKFPDMRIQMALEEEKRGVEEIAAMMEGRRRR